MNKQRHWLSGGALCALVLIIAWTYLATSSDMYVDEWTSSFFLAEFLFLFSGALLWTFRENNRPELREELIDWQCLAAFLLIIANQVYFLLPYDFTNRIAPVVSAYNMPMLVVYGVVFALLIRYSVSLYHQLEDKIQQISLQNKRLQQLLNEPLPETGVDMVVLRQLLENVPVTQASNEEFLYLLENCRFIDPKFFAWMQTQNIKLTPREILYCILIRMRKHKEDMMTIFGQTDGTYRTMRSRLKKHLAIKDGVLNEFLLALPDEMSQCSK